MEQQVDHFYDEDTGMFIINPEVKMAHVLGEDVDNPKATFRKIENIFDNRINLLSKAFFDIRKIADAQIEESNGLNKEIDDNFDNIENELYYKIKTLFSDFEKQNDELNAQNLLLQKYLTQLTKEKMDLLVQINIAMNKLDNIEKFLGINIANKRMKKSLNKKQI